MTLVVAVVTAVAVKVLPVAAAVVDVVVPAFVEQPFVIVAALQSLSFVSYTCITEAAGPSSVYLIV